MRDVEDPIEKKTWSQWNKQQLELARNDTNKQTNFLASSIRGVMGAIPTAILTLGSVTNLEDTTWNKWATFGVITGTFWFVVIFLKVSYQSLATRSGYRIWRLIRFFAVAGLLGFFICVIIFVPSVGGGIGLKNLVLIIFANFSVRCSYCPLLNSINVLTENVSVFMFCRQPHL